MPFKDYAGENRIKLIKRKEEIERMLPFILALSCIKHKHDTQADAAIIAKNLESNGKYYRGTFCEDYYTINKIINVCMYLSVKQQQNIEHP